MPPDERDLMLDQRIRALTIGHGRDPLARAAAADFAERWTAAGRTVVDVVDWPEQAASWLRQAKRFTAGAPDAWVVVGSGHGWAQMRRRLRSSTEWDPARTRELPTAALSRSGQYRDAVLDLAQMSVYGLDH